MQAIINAEVEKMEREGVIEASQGSWSSPIVVVKNNSHKFCIDK